MKSPEWKLKSVVYVFEKWWNPKVQKEKKFMKWKKNYRKRKLDKRFLSDIEVYRTLFEWEVEKSKKSENEMKVFKVNFKLDLFQICFRAMHEMG